MEDMDRLTQTEEAHGDVWGRFRRELNLSPESVLVSADGKIRYANRAAVEMIGMKSEDIPGRSLEDFVHPEDRERIRNLAGHRTKTGIYAERTETRIITRSNREMDLEIAALPVPCEEPDAVMLVLRDITERKRSEQKLLEANQKLQRLSNMDGLTDIANRRYFNAYMKQEWKRAARYSRPLSVIMLDIDYFKEYNDTYGHQGGDRILRETAQVLKKQLQRPGDLAARYGGEEFIFILPDTDAKGAAHMAEKLRKSIEAMKIPNLNSKCSEFVTASVGVASAIPTHLFQPDEMILQADKALYQAKQEGRNCVRVYNPN